MRIASTLLAAALVAAPLPAQAFAPEGDSAEALYEQGKTLYETADYEGAIEKWTAAYSMLGDDPSVAEIKTVLLYNIAGAHVEAYGIDEDITHLTKARVLLKRFNDNIDLLYQGEAADAEHARAQERIEELDAQIAEARAAEPEPEPEPEAQPEPEPEARPEPEPERGINKPLVISGAVVGGLGLGLIGLGVGAGVASSDANFFTEEALSDTDEGLLLRRDQIAFGQTMNALTYVGYIAGGVLVTTGAVLVVLGVRKRSRSRSARLTPTFGPGQVGVGLSGSF